MAGVQVQAPAQRRHYHQHPAPRDQQPKDQPHPTHAGHRRGKPFPLAKPVEPVDHNLAEVGKGGAGAHHPNSVRSRLRRLQRQGGVGNREEGVEGVEEKRGNKEPDAQGRVGPARRRPPHRHEKEETPRQAQKDIGKPFPEAVTGPVADRADPRIQENFPDPRESHRETNQHRTDPHTHVEDRVGQAQRGVLEGVFHGPAGAQADPPHPTPTPRFRSLGSLGGHRARIPFTGNPPCLTVMDFSETTNHLSIPALVFQVGTAVKPIRQEKEEEVRLGPASLAQPNNRTQ